MNKTLHGKQKNAAPANHRCPICVLEVFTDAFSVGEVCTNCPPKKRWRSESQKKSEIPTSIVLFCKIYVCR